MERHDRQHSEWRGHIEDVLMRNINLEILEVWFPNKIVHIFVYETHIQKNRKRQYRLMHMNSARSVRAIPSRNSYTFGHNS